MSTLSLIIAILALLVALAAWWETRRQANAAEQMSRIAVEEQKANFNRWLAAEKPWVRVSFPDSIPRPELGEPWHMKYDEGAPTLVCIENIGRLPCRLTGCWLDGQRVRLRLLQSSVVEHSVMGFLEGSVLAHGEILTFHSPRIGELAKERKDGDGFGLKLTYEFEPNMVASLEYSATSKAPDRPEDAKWVDLELVENSRIYSEEQAKQT